MASDRGITFTGTVTGQGPTVVLIPSLGRGGTDFDLLATLMREHGFSTLPLSPRVEAMDAAQTFEDLADQVARLSSASGTTPMHLVGHAYGQALARCVVARHPSVFDSLVLLARGGSIPADDVQRSIALVTDLRLSRTDPEEHLRHVARAFFAPGNDASVWAGGWYSEAAKVEMETMLRTPFERWHGGALRRTLVIQGIQDVIAPPEHGRAFLRSTPTATLVEVNGAGHALLPEQPGAIGAAVLDFLLGERG